MDFVVAASALAVGGLSFFSPCRFSLLPAYLRGFAEEKSASAWRMFFAGAVVSLGIASVVLAVGGALLVLWEAAKAFLRGMLLAGSLLVAIAGLLLYYNVPERLGASLSPSRARGLAGLYAYGLFYGSAIAGCGAPAFFLVFAWAAASGSLGAGLSLFAVYALGMSVLMMVTAFLIWWQFEAFRRLERHLPEMQRCAGALLVILGAWYALNYAAAIYRNGLGVG